MKSPVKLLATIVTATLFVACASHGKDPHTADTEPVTISSITDNSADDGRGRFRQIFCTVLDDHGSTLPDYIPCQEALRRVGEEPPGLDVPVKLGQSDGDYIIGLVPGLGWQCVKNWLDHDGSALRHVEQYGFDVRLFEVNGVSSSEHNAREIRDHISALPPGQKEHPIILLGYSKGIVDILQAVITYPEVRNQVVAVVSLAGAVGGSPLAADAKQSNIDKLAHIPRSNCDEGDSGAIASLDPEVRKNWLADNTLPDHIRYYSVIAYPDRDHLSLGLKSSWRKLAKVDARNDGQLIITDQFIPGATLLAFTNADHWAMSTPVARQLRVVRATIATRNKYPREAFLEAVLRYVEEDLARPTR